MNLNMGKTSKYIALLILGNILTVGCGARETGSLPNTPESSFKKGWEPQIACAYLSHLDGLSTRGYKDLSETGEYTCSSEYKKLGVQALPNTIAYYARGTENQINNLKLVLNVNIETRRKRDLKTLLEYSNLLVREATKTKLSNKMQSAISSGESIKDENDRIKIEVRRIDWSTGKGFEVQFILSR